jgi:outer membrane protein assembly factor BamB
MKIFLILIFFLFFTGCSFDDKSGIWNNENNISKNNEEKVFKDFKKIISSKKTFNKVLPIDKKFEFDINKPFQNKSWLDIFYNRNNKGENFKFSNIKQTTFKTKKLSRSQVNSFIFYDKDNLIFSDQKGNIIIYSIENDLIISKINFYKKKFKNIKKFLNLIVENKIIYITDNIGYVYAYNYEKDQILWAKNFKVPFRSNLKLLGDKLIASNQNNDLLILDKLTGNTIKLIPTEQTTINNHFVNNIALSDQDIFFLNTYGSLYAIEKNDLRLKWFINLNENNLANANNFFYGNPIIYYNDRIVASSNNNLYIFDSQTGTIINKSNISSLTKPILTNKYIFLVTENNLLVSMNLMNGEIIYSTDIEQKVSDFINYKKKNLDIKNIFLVNDSIFILLKNSHIINFSLKGDINEIFKLPSKMIIDPIFVDNSILYLNNKNRLIVFN